MFDITRLTVKREGWAMNSRDVSHGFMDCVAVVRDHWFP